jgi:hypothetical protein
MRAKPGVNIRRASIPALIPRSVKPQGRRAEHRSAWRGRLPRQTPKRDRPGPAASDSAARPECAVGDKTSGEVAGSEEAAHAQATVSSSALAAGPGPVVPVPTLGRT